eukprot:TRINITY_DN5989_c0_g1_i1.p1 TRINITY_DN5989_c0_g1~~TRINITY_DN5989_c0_g1_i1.p1  ORF type:complete len:227 (+),score=41.54 TRINITY_DN5989_c0_g1_i1:22-681(+)
MTHNILHLTNTIRQLLLKNSDPTRATGQKKYLKDKVECHGITAKPLDTLFKEHYNTTLSSLSPDNQIDLAESLLGSEYYEEKEFGIKLFQKNLKLLNESHFDMFQRVIVDHVNNWATSDNLSSKVLCEMIKRDRDLADRIAEWKDHDNIWVKRAACVSFVKIVRRGECVDVVFDIANTCVHHPERFVQLGNGWMLREVTNTGEENRDRLIQFIKEVVCD